MGQKTTVQKYDDITGEFRDDVERVEFAIEGKTREIDLSPESAGAFRELFAPYVAASRLAVVSAPRSGGGRKAGGSGTRSSNAAPSASSAEKIRNKAARDWARANGEDVAERGRLGSDVIARWEAAGSPMPDGSTAPERPEPQAADERTDDERAAAAQVAGVPAPESADPGEGVPAAGSAEAPAADAAPAETGKRGRRGGRAAASTTPTRPDAEPVTASA